MEPVRPMNLPTVNQTVQHGSRFSFRSSQGKKESVPVISDYYPKRIVYPYAKIDRRIDNRLVQAATVAQERAHAHSRSRCWHYVKDALLASGVIDSRPKTELARDAASELVQLRIQKTIDNRSVRRARWFGARVWYGAKRWSRGNSHQGWFRQRFPFTDTIASPADGRLRKAVGFSLGLRRRQLN
jgi:hypothetical protein